MFCSLMMAVVCVFLLSSFFPYSKAVFTASKDKSIHLLELNTQKSVWKQIASHEDPISSMIINGTQLFTGDDEGAIKVCLRLSLIHDSTNHTVQMWDVRSKDAVRTFEEHEDFIADMTLHKGKLLSAR